MFIFYTRKPELTALKLTCALEGCLYTLPGKAGANDVVVGWGYTVPDSFWTGKRVLNPTHIQSKLEELKRLKAGKIPCLSFREVPPLDEDLGDWYPRRLHHREGADFIKPPKNPVYWTKRTHLVREFRVNVMGETMIRWGEKLPRQDFPGPPDPVIRSFETGWKIAYGVAGNTMPDGFRKLAKDACRVVGYDFAGVDVGLTSDGRQLVIEVNSAPAIDGPESLRRWVEAFNAAR